MKTKIIWLLSFLVLFLIAGYGYSFFISKKANDSAKVINTSNLRAATNVNSLKEESKRKSISRTHCHNIRVKLTKLIMMGPYVNLEGVTDPEAAIFINDRLKLKADSKGVFIASFPLTYNEKSISIDASGKNGSSYRLVYKL
ncbi:MAG: hypothetical protein HY819_14185 [Acidobacteria bacterium]|nr:hypothetical protein [Acidobacteriota bacterium]